MKQEALCDQLPRLALLFRASAGALRASTRVLPAPGMGL